MWALLICLGLALAQQLPPSSTSGAFVLNPTACGDIVKSGEYLFNASQVYECLISVPFNAAVATEFIQYYNDTLQFQSTLAYLKSPPPSYQQLPVDLMSGLSRIQDDVDNGRFANEYAFEAALQQLIYLAHDYHLNLAAGILAPFAFMAPFEIASVSLDGIELPKVYSSYDLQVNQTSTELLSWQPSAITTINGQDSIEYLTQFAAFNSIGGLEAHADWNMLMQSPALDIQGIFEVFGGGATFYPGDTVTFTFENGTTLGPLPWLAVYNSPGDTGPLETGGDFYNFFVLGFYPASYAGNQTTASATGVLTPTPTPTSTSWNNGAYPSNPNVLQPDLGIDGGGFLTGYLLNDSSLAVLSIPSFAEFGDAIGTFSSTVTQFITRTLQAGPRKVVIDLQQNSGGDELLAIDTFKQFFPSIDPFRGSRMRAHPMANALGATMTNYWNNNVTSDEDYYYLVANEWVVTDRLDASTGQNFTSWADFFGPSSFYDGDSFTKIERYNLSSAVFDIEASGGIVVDGYANRNNTSLQPFAAEDIIILSDGLCSSSCAVFVEMMHHEAGVRTVAVGGRPSYGPMQVPGESRGAASYYNTLLDEDILNVQSVNTTTYSVLHNRTEAFLVTYASFNLRDQVRHNNTNMPLQFTYEPADCRIFFTPSTWYNYTNLWKYAADAMWSNPALCVKNSTAVDRSQPQGPPPSIGNHSLYDRNTSLSGPYSGYIPVFDPSEILDSRSSIRAFNGKKCTTDKDCQAGGHFSCREVPTCSKGVLVLENQCVSRCSSNLLCGGNCVYTDFQRLNVAESANGQTIFRTGFCLPFTPSNCASHIGSLGILDF